MDRQRPDLSTLSLPRSSRPGPVAGAVGCLAKLFFLAGVVGAAILGFAEADRRDVLPAWTKATLEHTGPGAPVTPPPRVLKPKPRGPAPLMAPVLGYVVAARRASIGFARAGVIKELLVDVGRPVEAGQVIARLDDALLRAELARTQVQLEDAKRELARAESLVKEGVGTDIDRDALRSKVKLIAAEQNLIAENLAQCETRAPFGGVVTAKHAEVGETVGGVVPGASGAGVVTIADLANPEVEADVPEARVEDLAPDQPAEVELDALSGVKLKAALRLVLPVADRRKATVPVRVVLKDATARLRPDMSARVTFLKTGPVEEEPVIEAPVVPIKPVVKPDPGADALAKLRELAHRAEKLPHAREAVGGAFALSVALWVLGFILRAVRSRPSPSKLAPPPPPAAPPPPPPKEVATSREKEKEPAPGTRTRHTRSSFRVLKQDSISDVESVEEIYVVEGDEGLESDDDEDEDVVATAIDRRVHALGPSGRITGEPWLLRPHRGRERPVLELNGVSVSFEVEDRTGVRMFPGGRAAVKIEGVRVPRDGVSLVHGMVFHVDDAPFVYMDRPPNAYERKRVYVVAADESTSISGKLIVESGEHEEAAPRAKRSRREEPAEDPSRPPLDGPPIVQIRGLEKTYYRGKHEVPVLRGVDLDIVQGDFVAFMGPSGSGKTTLLNVIGGIDRPTAGRVIAAGDEISSYGESRLAKYRAQKVGFIFQFYNLVPVLTAFENVEFPLLLTDLSKRERRDRTLHALSLVGMSDRASHRPRELSGGQEQRVAIARALVTDPPLLVADEPTGDLDAENAERILDLLVRLNSELRKTILMVTHDPNAADRARHTRHLQKGVLV